MNFDGATHCSVYVQQVSFLESVLELDFKRSGNKCSLTMMKQKIVTTLDSFALQKASPLRESVDRA